MPIRIKQSDRNKGFTLIELIVTIVILAIVMTLAVTGIMGYYKKMDMRQANESARQIYAAAQHKLSAMKASGQLDPDEMIAQFGLIQVPAGSAAAGAQTGNKIYYSMNTVKAKEFLNESGQMLDAELTSERASILMELDPQNGEVYGVFFATYQDSVNAAFDYAGSGKLGLQGGTTEFCMSEDTRSAGSSRIGYYGGDAARIEYQSSLKMPIVELVNGEELMLKISSYTQPGEFAGYHVKLVGENGSVYESFIRSEDLIRDNSGNVMSGNRYNLVLDSLAENYSLQRILQNNFVKTKGADLITGENITLSVAAVSGMQQNGTTFATAGTSFVNQVETSSLFAAKTKDKYSFVVDVTNARHLQNLAKIAGNSKLDRTDTAVRQRRDIDWKNTVAYYQELANTGFPAEDVAGNALANRAMSGGNEDAVFTPIPSGTYKFTAEASGKDLGEGGATDTVQKGYRILNVPISGTGDTGLFAKFSGPLSYVNLVNAKVDGSGDYVGALVGVYQGVKGAEGLRHCKVYLDPEADPDQQVFDYSKYSVSGGKLGTGGLIGQALSGKIQYSFAAINVVGAGGGAGGFVGDMMAAFIDNCYASGSVSGTDKTSLGGFVGMGSEMTDMDHCYATGDILSIGEYVGSFLGKYEQEKGTVAIRNSYAVGRQKQNGQADTKPTALGFIGNGSVIVGENCFYLGKEDSHGAIGLNLKQMTGLEPVRDNVYLNGIYRDNWRYPDYYGTGSAIQEKMKWTHPYYQNGDLKKEDKVYPYPSLLNVESSTALPVPHYGDWVANMLKEDDLKLFYYEKYGENDYGYYFRDLSFSLGLDSTKKILETGYGLMAREENGEVPKITGISGYYNANEKLKLDQELVFKPMQDFYLVIDGAQYYGLQIAGSEMTGSDYGAGSWQKKMLESYRGTGERLNYISFTYKEKQFYFNPCFAKAIGEQPADKKEAPAWLGDQVDPFVVRTQAQLKCIDGFGEYTGKNQSFYYFVQERRQIALTSDAWAPLCPNGFMGVYEGNNYIISGLAIKAASMLKPETNLGLFDTIGRSGMDADAKQGSAVVNLTVQTAAGEYGDVIHVDNSKEVDTYFGILAGRCEQSSYIQNCDTVLNATIKFANNSAGSNFSKPYTRTYIGGLVGYSNGTILGSQVKGSGEIQALSNQEVCGGGFAGILGEHSLVANGTDGTQCRTNTTVRVNGYVAGFAAENKGEIYDAYSGGNIEGGQMYSAGFVVVNYPTGKIQNCSSGLSVQEPVQVGNRGTGAVNSSAAGFVAVNGGTISNCNVYANVDTKGTYAAGFVVSNAGSIKDVEATISVETSNNSAFGFVYENVTQAYTMASDPTVNCRSELLRGQSPLIQNAQVYSLKSSRETVNVKGVVTGAGFAGRNDTTIRSSSAKVHVLVDSGAHASSAGFVLQNAGTVENCYSNSIVKTVVSNTRELDARAAGFAFENSGTIRNSYADCNTTARSDHKSYAAGFVYDNKGGAVIQNAYALLEIKAQNRMGTAVCPQGVASGFAYSNQGSIRTGYSAAYLSGKTMYGFANGGTTSNVYYLAFSGNSGATGIGQKLSEQQLRELTLDSNWGKGTVSSTHPNSPTLSGMAYPYPKLTVLDHYGDWPEVVDNNGAIFYYERYSDNSYGIYFLENNYRAYSTLSSSKLISDWGYGIIINGKSGGNHLEILARKDDGSTTSIGNQGLNAWVDNKELNVGEPLGTDYGFYPFKDKNLQMLIGAVKDSSYQYLYTKVEEADTYNFFNPCFAAAINTKSYASVDPSKLPDASFGKEGEPFEIRYADHLYYALNRGYESVGSNYRYFEQTHDVNLKDNASTATWNPASVRSAGAYTQESPFVGEYNGNGFAMQNYRLSNTTSDRYVGFWGYLGDGNGKGSARNINLQLAGGGQTNVTLNQKDAVMGLFAGEIAGGSTVENCIVDGQYQTSVAINGGQAVGGFAGINRGVIRDGLVRQLHSINAARNGTDEQDFFGGFAAQNDGTVESSRIENVGGLNSTNENTRVGGFVVRNNGNISECSVLTLPINSKGFGAGFAVENNGSIRGSDVTQNSAVISIEKAAAGFVLNNGIDPAGLANNDPKQGNYTGVEIINCSFSGNVASSYQEVSGFVRYNFGTITSSSVPSGSVTAKAGTHQTGTRRGAAGFCQTNLGAIKGNTYTAANVVSNAANIFASGFVIDNLGFIQGEAAAVIDASGNVQAAGSASAGFAVRNTGTIDYAQYSGSSVNGGTGASVAGFVCENGISEKPNAVITRSDVNPEAKVTLTGTLQSGGFAVTNWGSLEDCDVFGLMINSYSPVNVAGFVCDNKEKAVISRSTTAGTIQAASNNDNNYAAGFAAVNAGEISNQCSAAVSVTANYNSAGFVGRNESTGVISGNSLNPIKASGRNLQIIATSGKMAGFGIVNKGTIEYAAVQLTDGGKMTANTEKAAGFVWTNEAIIRNGQVTAGTLFSSKASVGFAVENLAKGKINDSAVTTGVKLTDQQVSGFVWTNAGAIANGTVTQVFNARDVFGFAYSNESGATIADSTVNSTGIQAANTAVGFVKENRGTMTKAAVSVRGNIIGQNVYGLLEINMGDLQKGSLTVNELTGTGTVSGGGLKNTGSVTGVALKMNGTATGQDVYGLFETNEKNGVLEDNTLTGVSLNATGKAAGFVHTNAGTIGVKRGESFADVAVSTTGAQAAGFVVNNTGTISGKAADAENPIRYVRFGGAKVTAGDGYSTDASGFVRLNTGTITYAAVEAKEGITAGGTAAGFVWYNQGGVMNSYVRANVTATNEKVSGFVIDNRNVISGCYTEGDVLFKGTPYNGVAAGFAVTNFSGASVEDCFAVSRVQSNAGNGAVTAGFAAQVNAGSKILNSYAASSVRAENGKRAAFEGTAQNATIQNSYWLDWEGTAAAAPSAAAVKVSMTELAGKTAALNGAGRTVWVDSTLEFYPFPLLKELPEPVAEFKEDPPFGVFYYEKKGGEFEFYQVAFDGTVTDKITSGMPEESGYGVYYLSSDNAPVVAGLTLQSTPLFSNAKYTFSKLDGVAQDANQLLDISAGITRSYYYINENFAKAVEYVLPATDGTVPQSKLGSTASDGVPYGIASRNQMEQIQGSYLDKSFVQLRDVDLGSTPFTPIGGTAGNAPFTGKYDGAGYDISNLTIRHTSTAAVPSGSAWGLFGYNNGQIVNTHVSGSITSTVNLGNGFFGGLVGRNMADGTVALSSANVDITMYKAPKYSTEPCVGGFVGENKGLIETSYSAGNVTYGGAIGGFAGQQLSVKNVNTAIIRNCYTTGVVDKTTQHNFEPGQFIGTSTESISLVENSFAYNETRKLDSGSVVQYFSFVGNGKATQSVNSYSLSLEAALSGIKRSPADMAKQETYIGFDFSDEDAGTAGVWTMKAKFPQLTGNMHRYTGYTVYTAESARSYQLGLTSAPESVLESVPEISQSESIPESSSEEVSQNPESSEEELSSEEESTPESGPEIESSSGSEPESVENSGGEESAPPSEEQQMSEDGGQTE